MRSWRFFRDLYSIFMMNRTAFIVVFLFPFMLSAQIRIEGIIKNKEDKTVIPFATISFPEQNIGTVSDMNGNFSIYIPDTSVVRSLSFSCIGYKKQVKLISDILRQRNSIYLESSIYNLDEVEVNALSYKALISLIDRVFRKARLSRNIIPCKLFYSLQSQNTEVPLELIEAFCLGKQSMAYGLEEMKMKNGRIGLNTESENKFMSLSSTNILVNFSPYSIPGNKAGLPSVPSNHSMNEMQEHFSFWEDGIIKEDTATLQKISFRSKRENSAIEGSILFYKDSHLIKQYDLWFFDAKGVVFPVSKADKLDSLDIHLTYNYKKNEGRPNEMLLERINMDYEFNYYTYKNDNYSRINTELFFLFYDYEHPFELPFFKDTYLASDYLKIWTFPHMDIFWEQNYNLPFNEVKEQHLDFFKEHGVIRNQEESSFNPRVEGLQSPLQVWSKERIDIGEFSLNALFSEDKTDLTMADLKKMKLTEELYNVDAQIFMDYLCVGDSLHFVTKTLINLDKSYFLPTPNTFADAFVNMYFDLYEMSRRNLEKKLKQATICRPEAVRKIYDDEMSLLNKNINRFKSATRQATDASGLIHWWGIINDSLQIRLPFPDMEMSLLRSYAYDDAERSVLPAYFYNTGTALLQLGQYEESVLYFTKAIEKLPDSNLKKANIYFNRAIAYYYLEDRISFCEDLNRVSEIEGSSEKVDDLLKHCH